MNQAKTDANLTEIKADQEKMKANQPGGARGQDRCLFREDGGLARKDGGQNGCISRKDRAQLRTENGQLGGEEDKKRGDNGQPRGYKDPSSDAELSGEEVYNSRRSGGHGRASEVPKEEVAAEIFRATEDKPGTIILALHKGHK